MIKKHYIFASLAGLGMMLGACTNEIEAPAPGADGMVTITAQLPSDIASRAFAQGTGATTLSYAVYESGTTNIIFSSEEAGSPQAQYSGDLAFTLSLNLVKGQTYDFVFWADAEGAPYTFDAENQTVTIDYTGIVGNDDTRDAFFNAEKKLLVTGAMKKNIQLRRPFAQLNIGTDDIDVAAAAKINHRYTTVTVKGAYSALNLFSGIASGAVDVTFPAHEANAEAFPVAHADASKEYAYLSMNYVLTGSIIPDANINEAQKETKDVVIALADDAGARINEFKLSAVPFQRNYRTNIYGSLLTSQVDFTIDIVPGFWEEPGHEYEVIDTPAEFLSVLTSGGKVAMSQDMVIDVPADGLIVSPQQEVAIEVGDHTLTINGPLFTVAGSKLTITGDNGELKSAPGFNLINVKGESEVSLEGLNLSYSAPKVNMSYALISVAEKDAKVTIKDCVFVPQVFAIATNATDPDQNGTIDMESVHIKQPGDVGSPFFVNIPLTVTAKDCVFEGALHAAFLRGGTHTFTNCVFTLTLDYDQDGNFISDRDYVKQMRDIIGIRSKTWGSGNTAPLCAVLMGNHYPEDNTHYRYPTTVTMTGCTLNIPDVAKETEEYGREYSLPAVYAYANPEEGKGVTFTYDETTKFGGAQDYASPNIFVNGVETHNCND